MASQLPIRHKHVRANRLLVHLHIWDICVFGTRSRRAPEAIGHLRTLDTCVFGTESERPVSRAGFYDPNTEVAQIYKCPKYANA